MAFVDEFSGQAINHINHRDLVPVKKLNGFLRFCFEMSIEHM